VSFIVAVPSGWCRCLGYDRIIALWDCPALFPREQPSSSASGILQFVDAHDRVTRREKAMNMRTQNRPVDRRTDELSDADLSAISGGDSKPSGKAFLTFQFATVFTTKVDWQPSKDD
jgi:hypothetical protein